MTMNPEHLKQHIGTLLEKLSISVTSIEISGENPTLTYTISTPDSALLIGNRGETLHAFNYLLKRIIDAKKSEGEQKLLVDVNGYYARRIETLEKEAHTLAERARLFKHDVEMSPMNAYERMVVHSLFADDLMISTASEGEGKFRHIVLHYREPLAACRD